MSEILNVIYHVSWYQWRICLESVHHLANKIIFYLVLVREMASDTKKKNIFKNSSFGKNRAHWHLPAFFVKIGVYSSFDSFIEIRNIFNILFYSKKGKFNSKHKKRIWKIMKEILWIIENVKKGFGNFMVEISGRNDHWK